jgi:selenocysteine lyase/cysteine desulfurase
MEDGMSGRDYGISRRRFLGTSVAAVVGTAAIGEIDISRTFAQAEPNHVKLPLFPSLEAIKPAGTLDEGYWWKVRSHFNIVDHMTFMNNGTEGPSPSIVVAETQRMVREIAEDPSNNYRTAEVDLVREKVAAFVGASPDEIVLTRSTSEGMNIFANGLDWKAGDEVLMNNHEHGGGIGPYRTLEKRYGIKIVTLDVSPLSPFQSIEQIVDLYAKAITPRTKVLMVSHIPYVTGTIMPVKELADLAHGRGILISVDGAHPLGMLELNLKALGVDHYAAAGQKWMLSGTGNGVCYIKREIQDRVWPIMGPPGEPEKDKPEKGARKYEGGMGQRNVPSVFGLSAAIDFMGAIGLKNVEMRDRALSDRLRQGLAQIPGVKVFTPSDPKLSAGLTLFGIKEVPMNNVQKAIFEHSRVWIRTMSTGNLNACRAATHIYNFPHEVDRLLDSVRYVAQNSSKFMTPTSAALYSSQIEAMMG